MAQLAEAGGLNPPKYGFKSHWGHPKKCHLTRYYSDFGTSINPIRALIGPLGYRSSSGLLGPSIMQMDETPSG